MIDCYYNNDQLTNNLHSYQTDNTTYSINMYNINNDNVNTQQPSTKFNYKQYSILLIPMVVFILCITIIYTYSNILSHKVIFNNNKALYDYGLPNSVDEVSELSGLLNQYFTDNNNDNISIKIQLISLYILIFITKQTFSIPGSAILNILSGCTLPLYISFPLVSLLTTIGATCCYIMSKLLGDTLATTLFNSTRLYNIRYNIEQSKNSNNLFYYLLSLRLLPFSPQFLLNIVSPICNIPLIYFIITCFIGLMPYCYITTSAGNIIAKIALSNNNDQTMSFSDIFDTPTILKLLLLAILSLLPVIYHSVIKNNTKQQENVSMYNNDIPPANNINSPLLSSIQYRKFSNSDKIQ